MNEKERHCLSFQDRQLIFTMRESGIGIREIGRRVKRDASIISRELRRNSLPVFIAARLTGLERAKEAQNQARRRRKEKRRGKRKARPLMLVFDHVAEKLAQGWGPETIASTIGAYFSGLTLSTSTIYRLIKRDARELIKHLPERGKKRRLRVVNRRGRFQQGAAAKRHKDERCVEAETRAELGHLEGDSILSKRGSKAAVLSICDRKARKRWYIKVPDLKADTIRKALVVFLYSLPPYLRKTLTLDRGAEFAEWDMLEKIFAELRVYFCTPYAPHEKGSVERSNRDFRRRFPKGTDFALVQDNEVRQAECNINNRPMKCLGWRSPNAYYQEECARIEQELYQKAA